MDKITKLEVKLHSLTKRVEALERDNLSHQFQKWKEISVPTDPVSEPVPLDEQQGCPVCGINAENGMFYVCPNSNCPGRMTFTCSFDERTDSLVSDTEIDRALRMTTESRLRMNTYSADKRAELEASARLTMSQGDSRIS